MPTLRESAAHTDLAHEPADFADQPIASLYRRDTLGLADDGRGNPRPTAILRDLS